jgi:DUF971 family protein
MTSQRVLPEEIGPTEDATALRIRWRDGHISVYSPRQLRILCPCAGCVDELTGERILDASQIDAGVHPLAIEYVGRYALQFQWSDGHRTGIYPFDYLRRLCDCEECRSTSGGDV